MNKEELEILNFSTTLKDLYEQSILNKKVSGLSTINNLSVIRVILLKENCLNTLEIGLAFGASALTFLSTLKEIDNSSSNHSAIDPFQKRDFANSAINRIKNAKLDQKFNFFDSPSYEVLPELLKNKKKYDLIYIDGSHRFEDIFVDFYYSSLILEMNGIILFDDCTRLDAYKVIKFIKTNYKRFFNEIEYKKYDKRPKKLIKKIANKFGYKQLYGFQKIAEPPRSRFKDPLKNF